MGNSPLSDIANGKSFAMSDNGKEEVLCTTHRAKLFHFPKPEQSDFRSDSEFVYKTSPLGITPGLARKPLRLIVARFPESTEVQPGYFLTHYRDTLSCGHQVVTYSFESTKKRRGCEQCREAKTIPFPRKRGVA